MGHWSGVSYGQALSAWEAGQVGGGVYAWGNSDVGPDWGDFDVGHDAMRGEEARQTSGIWMAVSEAVPSIGYVFIAYHWPVIGYVAGWAGLIVWRSRKYRAFAKAE